MPIDTAPKTVAHSSHNTFEIYGLADKKKSLYAHLEHVQSFYKKDKNIVKFQQIPMRWAQYRIDDDTLSAVGNKYNLQLLRNRAVTFLLFGPRHVL